MSRATSRSSGVREEGWGPMYLPFTILGLKDILRRGREGAEGQLGS